MIDIIKPGEIAFPSCKTHIYNVLMTPKKNDNEGLKKYLTILSHGEFL